MCCATVALCPYFQIMSGGLAVMGLEENDVIRFLAAATHLGTNNVNFQMEQYIYKRRQDGEISG